MFTTTKFQYLELKLISFYRPLHRAAQCQSLMEWTRSFRVSQGFHLSQHFPTSTETYISVVNGGQWDITNIKLLVSHEPVVRYKNHRYCIHLRIRNFYWILKLTKINTKISIIKTLWFKGQQCPRDWHVPYISYVRLAEDFQHTQKLN